MKILKAKCKICGDTMESLRGGHWVSCKCKKSYIDRDRWFPDKYARFGGECTEGIWITEEDE